MKVEIGRAGDITCALADADRLDDFRVVVEHELPVEAAGAAMATAGAGGLLGANAWVSISWLRSQLAEQEPSFWIGFDGMVSYAKSHGWLSGDRTALQAHVEYQNLKQTKE